MGESSINVKKVKGDVVGAGVEGSGNIFGKEITIKGNVLIISPSGEGASIFNRIRAIQTEVRPGEVAGIKGSKTVKDNEGLQKGIDGILDLLETSGKGQINEVQAGNLHISRVDLLLKKAILLKSDADEMLNDYFEQNKDQLLAKSHGNVFNFYDFFLHYDEAGYSSKLKEAYSLLKEANELDPANTEVLLHIAELLMRLTPDDPKDEQKILNRIKNLLSSPKNETEMDHLAQATFLLAISNKDKALLQDARTMFVKLGNNEMISTIDQLIVADSLMQGPGYQLSHYTSNAPQMPYQAGFQPMGKWHIQVMDPARSMMDLDVRPDGTFQCSQQAIGLNIQAAGRWAFNPYNNMLQLQGLINGFQPFMLGVIIQGQQNNGYYAIGSDGFGYFFAKA